MTDPIEARVREILKEHETSSMHQDTAKSITDYIREAVPEDKIIPLKNGDRFYKREQGWNAYREQMLKNLEGR